MEFMVRKHQGGWGIRCMDGTYVAVAEALEMSDVRLVGTSLVGTVEAVWGAMLKRRTESVPGLSRHLGINRYFRVGAVDTGNGALAYFHRDLIYDSKSNHLVRRAAYISIHAEGARYMEKKC